MDEKADLVLEGEGAKSSLGGDRTLCADFNRDGYGDILTGAYNWQHEDKTGRAHIFYGSERERIDTKPDRIFSGEIPNIRFGHDVGCGDFNSDGYYDVVVGAWSYKGIDEEWTGRAWVYCGGPDYSHQLEFKWGTTNTSPGMHTLKAPIVPLSGEEDTTDSTMTVTVEVKK